VDVSAAGSRAEHKVVGDQRAAVRQAVGVAGPVQAAVVRPRDPPVRRDFDDPVAVDARVELISIIFRLAGNPEYSRCLVPDYARDLDAHFACVREHPVVLLARKLRANRGVSYDAPMSLAVHLKDSDRLELRVPLEPWPDGVDKYAALAKVLRGGDYRNVEGVPFFKYDTVAPVAKTEQPRYVEEDATL
jgi:hypothetical protein